MHSRPEDQMLSNPNYKEEQNRVDVPPVPAWSCSSCSPADLRLTHRVTTCYFLSRPPALKWYRAKCNIQAEIEEMQEEQRSLSSLETLSVWKLLMDDSVRWQVLSVVVINIGMQLSGIDAVSTQKSRTLIEEAAQLGDETLL